MAVQRDVMAFPYMLLCKTLGMSRDFSKNE